MKKNYLVIKNSYSFCPVRAYNFNNKNSYEQAWNLIVLELPEGLLCKCSLTVISIKYLSLVISV